MFLADNLSNSFVFWFQSQVAEKGRETQGAEGQSFFADQRKREAREGACFRFHFPQASANLKMQLFFLLVVLFSGSGWV